MTTPEPRIRVVTGEEAAGHRPAIVAPLIAFNRAAFGPSDREVFAAVLEDPSSGTVVGGLFGETSYGWAYIQLLVVPEEHRGRDLGTRLIAEAEAVARARGCRGIFLDTFDFQARGFYEACGYTLFGTLEGDGRAVTRYFLQKRWPPAGD